MNKRSEFCEKDTIRITYTDDTVCFEDMKTAESVLFNNSGDVLHSNFDSSKTAYFKSYFNQIISSIITLRNLDGLETA